ncbi:hypothetical protein ACQ4PT_019883 [Festuca glaucescens]
MAPSSQPATTTPHVLLFPYPAQGHVNPFLRLAKALHARGFYVTFVHTEHNHGRLLRSRGPGAVAGAAADGLRFETIPDGLPRAELDATQDIWALCEAAAGMPRPHESCFTNGYLDTPLDWIAGMISNIRLRDLPTFIRTTDADDTMLTINIKQCELDAPAADGILLNTFEGLERAALDAIRARLPNTFTVGPLGPEVSPPSYLPSLTSSLWKEDDRCVAWLDTQPADGSVVYVNFGSITVVTREQMVEFARGLAAAGSPFLWVVRPDMVRDGVDMLPVPEGFVEEVAMRGLMVTNCRYACEEWGVGVELAREAGQAEVEAAVRELMGDGEKAAAMRRKAAEWKEKAARAVAAGGSSQRDLDRFVDEIVRA